MSDASRSNGLAAEPADEDILELDASFLGDAAVLYGEDEEEEEDDISEEEAELQEEPVFTGPTNWDQVDRVELEQIMLRVTAAAIPSTDGKDVSSRLALQAAALETDNADPLGLGRIDPRQLTLIRLDEARKAWRGRHVGGSRRRGGKRDTTEAAEALASTSRTGNLVTPENVQEMRTKALPSSDLFDPDVFLGTIHANTRLGELVKGRQNLTNEVSERTSQLKALVKENFDRFISCKNTIDDIHKRLRKSEAHDNLAGSGSSTSDMVIALSEVQDEARRAFANLLERATASEQVKSVVALLKRYEGLFQLPSRIRQGMERGEYDQVINEYKKAKALMEGIAAPNTKSVWHKLFTEVDKSVGDMVQLLSVKLKDAQTPQLAAIEAIRHVLLLQAENAACANELQPFDLYTTARELELKRQMKECGERHRRALQAVREAAADANMVWPAPVAGNGQSQESSSTLAEATVWAAHVHELAATMGTSVADFWHAPQEKVNQLAAVPGSQAMLQAALATGMRIGEDFMNSFSEMLQPALRKLVQLEEAQNLFLAAIKDIVGVFLGFRARPTPPFVTECLQNLLETACELVIEQMVVRLKRLTQRMAEHEDFEIIATSHKAGHACSRVPAMFKAALMNSMQQLEDVVTEGSRAYSEAGAITPLEEHGSSLRHAFFDSFTGYAVATDQLWATVCSKSGGSERARINRDTKLLVLHSNCVSVRTQVLKELSNRYESLLHSDGGYQEGRELQAECAEDVHAVEARLAGIYIQSRMELLNDVLEEYFEDDGTVWSEAPLPTGPRDCAFEIINALVSVQAEVYTNALSLQRRVMDELLQHLLSAYNTYLSERVKELNPGGALQMLMELQYFGEAMGPMLRPPRDGLITQARTALLKRVDELAKEEGSATEKQLDGWCETIQGGLMSGRAEMVCTFLVHDLLKATRLNVASFKA